MAIEPNRQHAAVICDLNKDELLAALHRLTITNYLFDASQWSVNDVETLRHVIHYVDGERAKLRATNSDSAKLRTRPS